MITVSGNSREELIKQLAEIGLFLAPASVTVASAPVQPASQAISAVATPATPAQPAAVQPAASAEEEDAGKPENLRRVRGANADKLFNEMAAKLQVAPITSEADLLAFATSVTTDLARLPQNKADEFSVLIATRKAALASPVQAVAAPATVAAAPVQAVAAPATLPPFNPAPAAAATTLPQPHPLDAVLQTTAAQLEGLGWPRETLQKLIQAATGQPAIHTLPLDEDGSLRRHRLNAVFEYCKPTAAQPWPQEGVNQMPLEQVTGWLDANLPLTKVKEMVLAQGLAI